MQKESFPKLVREDSQTSSNSRAIRRGVLFLLKVILAFFKKESGKPSSFCHLTLHTRTAYIITARKKSGWKYVNSKGH